MFECFWCSAAFVHYAVMRRLTIVIVIVIVVVAVVVVGYLLSALLSILLWPLPLLL